MTLLSAWRTKAEHLSVVSSTNLWVKYSPGAEIQSRKRVGWILIDGFSTWRSCTQYFGRKISRQRFHSRNKIEQKLITTNIRFTNGIRSVWGSYSNIRHLSNSLCIRDEVFLSRSYTCDSPPYSSHHLPKHALMRKVMMEMGRVQRRKKREDTPRGLHKSPMTTTTQQYDMKVQG